MRRKWSSFTIIFLVLFVIVLFGSYLVPLSGKIYSDPQKLAPSDGYFITVDGVKTFVQEAGRLTDEPVILIHGFGGGTFNWRSTIPSLAEHGYRAIAFDLKGFHLSQKSQTEDYSHPSQAEFIASVMNQLKIEKASFVAHSMGANVVSHFALKYPERVSKLIFVDAALSTEKSIWVSMGASLLKFPPLTRWGQIFARSLLSEERIEENLNRFYHDHSLITKTLVSQYAAVTKLEYWDIGLVHSLSDYDKNVLPKALSAITEPILVVWGTEDKIIPIEEGEALYNLLPSAEWNAFSNSGHVPMEDRPESFNTRVIEFLK